MEIIKNFDLTSYNSLQIKAVAKNAFFIHHLDDLHQFSKSSFSHKEKLILGSGSNILIKQQQLDFPVIINQIYGKQLIDENKNYIYIKVSSAENWDKFVDYCLDHFCLGLENLALIPGTVGACPIQNIGAYGIEVKDFIHYVEYFDFRDHCIHQINNEDCQFYYRDSIFKHQLKNQTFITSVVFKFAKQYQPNTKYQGISDALASLALDKHINERQTLDDSNKHQLQHIAKSIAHVVRSIRQKKLPNPEVLPNVGSFFKNPILSKAEYANLQLEFLQLPAYYYDDEHIKTSAAWLIEQCGFKGLREPSGAGVSEQHALVLVNYARQKDKLIFSDQYASNISGQDILYLAKKIQTCVHQKFNISLEIEPIVIS